MRLDLTQEAQAHQFILPPDLLRYSCPMAVETWRSRMVNEYVSFRVFAGLVPQFRAAGFGAAWEAKLARMSAQEIRHGQLCAAVVASLGGTAVAEVPPLAEMPAHVEIAPLEAVLRNTLSISCLNETTAVALLESERRQAGAAPLQEVLTEILADEVQHARLGWTLLEELHGQLEAPLLLRLGAYLVPAFRQLIGRHYTTLHEPRPELAALGVCDDRRASAMFLDTVDQVIIPGLEQHGIPAGAAWRVALAA